jgi:tetratricopeptide (TPR) repeat protein
MSQVGLLMMAGDFAGALRALRATLEEPRDFGSYNGEGNIQLALGNFAAAVDCFERAEERAPSAFNGITAEKRAITQFLNGDTALAIEALEHHIAEIETGRVGYSSDTFGLGPRLRLVALLTLSKRKEEARRVIGGLLAVCEGFSAWPVSIARFLQGDLSNEEFLDLVVVGSGGVRMSGRAENRFLCVAEFYVGVMYELHGFSEQAMEIFQKAAARNVTVEPEWYLAHGVSMHSSNLIAPDRG